MLGHQGGAVEDAHEAIVRDDGDDALALGHRGRHRVPNMRRATYSLICGGPRYVTVPRFVVVVAWSDVTY
jgi:hypothetical protein